ncbi:hypothetical protein M595_6039 [Lyngbya aestuarii BL J]|uniref:Uncharacterized protein n=1 Tax=Lyngbya aestuarii BL J TaxID=1348334 RepID=U7QA18_9CYAN|nr:hypothetical protein [Lyngbya aestuarii]ERT04017.1 hypothetical protein M595_6039 [Lyngbya aestuarii BL J]
MDEKKQQDLRRHAAENFFNSFEKQLLETFQESESEPAPPAPPIPPAPTRSKKSKKTQNPSPEPIDLSALEEAIADIDQYLQNQSPQPPEA